MARILISTTLYLVYDLDVFLLKNTIGLLSWVIAAPNCIVEASVYISKGFMKSG
jgi:hypothetical protein